jgi:BirA family biotin operon repressor/biotin-[acetyl-CoA-carboxylase] ligase
MHWDIHTRDEAISTQDLVKESAAEGASQGYVLHALRQNSGYGRYGREWISLEGNLFFSLILRPACDARLIEQMSMVVGVALAEAMRPYLTDAKVMRLKAPNDVLLDGRKVAGILIESSLSAAGQVEWIVVGLGVNIAAAPPESPFSALNEFSAKPVEIDRFRDDFLEKLAERYSDWQGGGFEGIRAQWEAFLQ